MKALIQSKSVHQFGVVTGLMLLAVSCSLANDDEANSKRLPPPKLDLKAPAHPGELRTAVFAGGCFWCAEAVFEQLAGVTSVVSGFAGGTADTAQYHTVSSGTTQHAESVQVTYDPAKISYATLLQVFFNTIHPTQKEGQGPDWGHQYRSAIFYDSPAQKAAARAYIDQLDKSKIFENPIATTIEPLERFYPAEDYHQHYVQLHPDDPYVRAWSIPKIEKVRRLYPELLKTAH